MNGLFVFFFYKFLIYCFKGRLHLGHAFSLTKTEFAARFHTLLGEQVLFPFAFHCKKNKKKKFLKLIFKKVLECQL